MTIEEELLTTILDCGIQDIDKLLNLITDYENLGGDIEDVNDYIKYPGVTISFGTITFAVMNLMMNQITDYMEKSVEEYVKQSKKEKYIDKIEEIRENFDPYINYMDSWYNNHLDEIDLDSLPINPDVSYIELIDEWK